MPDQSKSKESLVDAFREAVLQQNHYMTRDHKLANANFYKAERARKELASLGEEGLSALSCLLHDASPIVRCRAGMYLIRSRSNEVIPVLQSIVEQRGPGFPEALVTLEKWKRGLYLDPLTGAEQQVIR